MSRYLYSIGDAVVLWLWTWFGIRRRWLMVLGVLVATPDAVTRWYYALCFAVFVGLCAFEYIMEELRSAEATNVSVLDAREQNHWKFFIGVLWPISLAADAFSYLIGKGAPLSTVASIGLFSFQLMSMSLVPTTPRKRIKFPRLSISLPRLVSA